MFEEHLTLIISWILFSILHSVFALTKWKLFMQNIMQQNYKYYRLLYSCFAAASLTLIVFYNFYIQTIQLWQASLIEIILSATGIILSTFIIFLFAKRFFFELSGADVLTDKIKRSDALINTGFYKYVRHPLYTATLLLIWSLFFLQPQLSNFISCICVTAYTLTGITFEEKKLVKHFGQEYLAYKKNTPMLIPTFINIRNKHL